MRNTTIMLSTYSCMVLAFDRWFSLCAMCQSLGNWTLWCSQTLRCSIVPLPTEEESVDGHTVTLSVIASNANSRSWSNKPMKFQESVDAGRNHISVSSALYSAVYAWSCCFLQLFFFSNHVTYWSLYWTRHLACNTNPVTSWNGTWRGTAEGELLWFSQRSGEKM